MSAFDAFMACVAFLVACISVSAGVLFIVGTMINKKKGKFDTNNTVVGFVMSVLMILLGLLFLWLGIQFIR